MRIIFPGRPARQTHSLAELLTLTLVLAAPSGGWAQTDCPRSSEVAQSHLLGLWRAEFEGLSQGATLPLERHPNYTQSVSGAVNRDGARGRVAGDVEDGEFTLEESSDGVRISATWTGDVVDGSCGREIRGTWQAAAGAAARPFILRKMQP